MDDFGHEDEAHQEVEVRRPIEPGMLSAPTTPVSPGVRISGSPRPESPAPFSQYPAPIPPIVPQIHVTRPSTEVQKMEAEMEEERESGCCKCVIM